MEGEYWVKLEGEEAPWVGKVIPVPGPSDTSLGHLDEPSIVREPG